MEIKKIKLLRAFFDVILYNFVIIIIGEMYENNEEKKIR